MNSDLVKAANLQTFHKESGLSPTEYVQQEMASRNGKYDAISLREKRAKIIAAQCVRGLALVILLRVLNKEDPTQQGFVVVAYDLAGRQLYHTGLEGGGKLPKSQKTGYREYGQVAAELANDPSLLADAIERERDASAQRAAFLTQLLQDVPAAAANDAGEDEPEPGYGTVAAHSGPDAVQEPDTGHHAAMSASPKSRAQGSRRKS
jgi:hypothetical protein